MQKIGLNSEWIRLINAIVKYDITSLKSQLSHNMRKRTFLHVPQISLNIRTVRSQSSYRTALRKFNIDLLMSFRDNIVLKQIRAH